MMGYDGCLIVYHPTRPRGNQNRGDHRMDAAQNVDTRTWLNIKVSNPSHPNLNPSERNCNDRSVGARKL